MQSDPGDTASVNTNLPARKRAMPLLNGTLIGVVLLFCFAMLEAGARLYLYGALTSPPPAGHGDYFVAHPQRGWVMRPNATLNLQTPDFVTTTCTNSRGMNDEEYAYEKEEGVFRIVLLGDSFMFGREVRRDEGLPALLETQDWGQRVEVINLGAIAYGTIQEYLCLIEQGLRYDPDLVLLAFYAMNDVCDNSEALNRDMWGDIALTWGRPYLTRDAAPDSAEIRFPDFQRMEDALDKYQAARPSGWAAFAGRIALARLAMRAWAGVEGTVGLMPAAPGRLEGVIVAWPEGSPQRQMWDAAWQDTATALAMIRDAAAANGVPFAIFAVPGQVQVEPRVRQALAGRFPDLTIDWQAPHDHLKRLAAGLGVPCLDLLPDFARAVQEGGGPYYFSFEDIHWTAAGHLLAADRLAAWLKETGLVAGASRETLKAEPLQDSGDA